jgi:hypothetical protein
LHTGVLAFTNQKHLKPLSFLLYDSVGEDEAPDVMISPCPSPKQAGSNKIAALKRHACDFMGQQRTDGNAGLSYLESADNYKYNTLAIGRLIVQ